MTPADHRLLNDLIRAGKIRHWLYLTPLSISRIAADPNGWEARGLSAELVERVRKAGERVGLATHPGIWVEPRETGMVVRRLRETA